MTHVAEFLAAAALAGISGFLATPAQAANCFGGVIEAIKTVTHTGNVSYSSVVFFTMPDSTISAGASGAAGDLDTYTLTWSGQSTNNTGAWKAQAQVSVNGGAFVAIDPVGPNIMHSGSSTETNTMSWCTRLQATTSAIFRIQFARFNGGTVTLNHYLTRIERSN